VRIKNQESRIKNEGNTLAPGIASSRRREELKYIALVKIKSKRKNLNVKEKK
jgi:hypothetical protein